MKSFLSLAAAMFSLSSCGLQPGYHEKKAAAMDDDELRRAHYYAETSLLQGTTTGNAYTNEAKRRGLVPTGIAANSPRHQPNGDR